MTAKVNSLANQNKTNKEMNQSELAAETGDRY